MIFHSKELKKSLNKIDQFEGSNYKELFQVFNVNDGTKTESYIYVVK